MFSSIQSKPLTGLEILKTFDRELDILGASEDADKVIRVMEKLLRESSLGPSSEISLVGRVKVIMGFLWGESLLERALAEIQKMLSLPPLREDADPRAVQALQKKMKAKLESKIERLKIVKILAKDVVRSVIGADTGKDEELKKHLEADPDLEYDYICLIERTLVGSDVVYLEKDGKPLIGRYHEDAIKKWLQNSSFVFNTNFLVTEADIRPDLEAIEFIKQKILAWIDFKRGDVSTPLKEVEEIQNKKSLLTVAAAYPIVKKKYEEVLAESQSVILSIEKAETYAKATLTHFISLMDGVNIDEVFPECYSCIEDLIRLMAGEDLETVRTEFQEKLKCLIAFSHEVVSDKQLSSFLKKKVLKKVEGEIGKGASLSRVKEIVEECEVALKEEVELKKDFPNVLIGGNEDWARLSKEVDYVPIPKGMKALAKRLGETHVLALVPDRLAGRPLTLERFGALLKAKGCFPGSRNGYLFLSSAVMQKCKRNPVTGPKWVFMTRGVLLGTRGETFDKQKIVISDLAKTTNLSYKLPNALDAVVCIYMNYLATGMMLFGPGTYTRGQEWVDGEYPVVIGGFIPDGLYVDCYFCYGNVNIGLAALCEVPASGL